MNKNEKKITFFVPDEEMTSRAILGLRGKVVPLNQCGREIGKAVVDVAQPVEGGMLITLITVASLNIAVVL